MLEFNAEKVILNARGASTEELLDRVTVYRGGMEPEALEIIERELRSRGVKWEAVADHGDRRAGEVLMDRHGVALRCSFCDAPAVAQGMGWHRGFGLMPVLPRKRRYCQKHRPSSASERAADVSPPVGVPHKPAD